MTCGPRQVRGVDPAASAATQDCPLVRRERPEAEGS
jgi:hypothetical protein